MIAPQRIIASISAHSDDKGRRPINRMPRSSHASRSTPLSLPSVHSVDSSRPNKRMRAEAAEMSEEGSGRRIPSQTRHRTRAAIACAVCRDRKTRCDGVQPLCGYCVRTNSTCQYDTVDVSTDRTSYVTCASPPPKERNTTWLTRK